MSEEGPVDTSLLRRFSPLDGMKKDNLLALARKISRKQLPASRYLFKEGDKDKRTYWLTSGLMEVLEGDRTVAMIRGGSPEAHHPLAPQLPRRFSARAIDPIEFLVVDSELLDMMITWDQTGTYEVAELQAQIAGGGTGGDWMTLLLQTQAFHRIPPANIQAIFTRMQRVACRAGETVIQQGAEGDYFYAIVSGKCLVARETPLNRDGLKLAELGVGDTFGEEALISEAKRNATVTMLTDGVLMRLNKDNFRELLNEPLVQWVSYPDARAIVGAGGRWLDVRLPSEHQNRAIGGSINIPLYFIRMKLSTLDRGIKYVVYCDTGRRSSAAAFILVERGFDTRVLRGGLDSAELTAAAS
ncbi:MAG TPA: cyclic nucleotide-binding domain-containing protein [Steroidobacteraceae bacterium]|jgi:CRP-like cAMP-binding protein|nr:cyclic nucleotide-binding domain-containing protein [Steroidobacteraceae bacterium]